MYLFLTTENDTGEESTIEKNLETTFCKHICVVCKCLSLLHGLQT